MMMKRKDSVISDYELIWEGRFKDWYPNKYKFHYVVKETYGENIRVENKILNTQQISKQIADNLQQNRYNEAKKIEKVKENEKRKIELKQREEYLKKLFEREAQEMQERLRKAKEEQYLLKERTQGSMIANLEKNKETNVSMLNTISILEKSI